MNDSGSSELPEDVRALLDGSELERKEGETFLLVSQGDDGWPHVAMLSVGEMLAAGPREIRLALWPSSRTTANLTRNGHGLVIVVPHGRVLHLRLRCRRETDLILPQGSRAFFIGHVEAVRVDTVGYAKVTSGISFKLVDPSELDRWRTSVKAMAERNPAAG